MKQQKTDAQRLEELEQALQCARARAAGKKRLLTPKRVLLVAAVLLILNLSATGVFFASFISSSNQADEARAATFVPVIDYGESWSYSQSLGAATASTSSLGFIVDSTKVEVATKAVVTITHQGILPLDYLLYPCAESEIATSTPCQDPTVNGNVITYEIEIPVTATAQQFTLVTKWRSGAYSEYYNGLTDTTTITVICEQI